MSTQSDGMPNKYWVLFLCLLMMASNYIDRSIVVILAQPIKEAFALSDMQVGALGGLAFAALYILAGVPLARLADRFNRVTLIGASIAVWSAMTAFCGLAQSYWQLFLFRVGVGIGEAGASPAAQSLLSDCFAPGQRASAISVFSLGGPIGSIFGAMAVGYVAAEYDWRAAFFLVGLPGLVLAVVFKLTIREPQRGVQDASEGVIPAAAFTPSLWATTRYLFTSRTFLHLVTGAAIANFALQGIFQFSSTFFIRQFEIGMAEVGLIIGLVGGLCGGLGTLIGGFGTDRAARSDPRWYLWIPASGLFMCTPMYAAAFLQSSWQSGTGILMIAALLSYIFIAPMLSITQNLVSARMRATAVAVLTVVTALFGVAIGPMMVGWLSDLFASASFANAGLGEFKRHCLGGQQAGVPEAVAAACRLASGVGVQRAVIASSFLFLWAGVHFLLATRFIRRDLAIAASESFLEEMGRPSVVPITPEAVSPH